MVQSSIFSRISRLTKDEVEEFESLYKQLVQDLVKNENTQDMPETLQWLKRAMDYNIPHGKKFRGLLVPMTYKCLVQKPTEEDMKLCYVLGWCVEILQASFLVADDIMDASETRRGQPCWYKVDNMGPIAFNDSLLLEHITYRVLTKYFKDKPYYGKIVDLFLDITYKTILGQSLDTQTGKERNMEDYTMERYSSIVKYKTSYYTTYLPVALTMAMIGTYSEETWKKAEKITLEIGHFFQVQDDYLDCFGDEKITGKVGTDIQDCKCSWLFVIAKDKCGPKELKQLKEIYGIDTPEKIEEVKKLYRELAVDNSYIVYEENTVENIGKMIQGIHNDMPGMVFYNLLGMLYKRTK